VILAGPKSRRYKPENRPEDQHGHVVILAGAEVPALL
jgi:hypothetical protein